MILNLTQHSATPDQIAAGVVEPNYDDKLHIARLLTFNSLPSPEEIQQRAEDLACIARQYPAAAAMIGGAPYLMSWLERPLLTYGIEPVYAFSERASREEALPDDSVRKVSEFRFGGFVRPYDQKTA